MKFKIKNCPECAWWNSPERFEPREFCTCHEYKEKQPPEIIKAIKKVKKERRESRITNWIFALICLFFATWDFIGLFSEQKKWRIIFCSISLTLWTLFLLSTIREIINDEKTAKQELKELQKKLSEWIILK